MKNSIYLILIALLVACSPQYKEQDIFVSNYDGIEPYFKKKNDTTYVINFWATWCAPCVKELPAFEQLNAEYKDKPVKVILLSLDNSDHIDSRLKPFMKENAINSQVILLDDPDSNSWIPKIDPHWDGAIPVTLIYNKDKKRFFNRSFDYSELNEALINYLK